MQTTNDDQEVSLNFGSHPWKWIENPKTYFILCFSFELLEECAITIFYKVNLNGKSENSRQIQVFNNKMYTNLELIHQHSPKKNFWDDGKGKSLLKMKIQLELKWEREKIVHLIK